MSDTFKDGLLNGKNAFIAGGTSGINLGIARRLAKAGASADTVAARAWFLARRFPLGAIGAVIMVLFVGTAIFADVIAPFSPFTTNPAHSLARPAGASRSPDP